MSNNHICDFKEVLVLDELKLKSGWDERIRFLQCVCGETYTYPKYALQCALGDGTDETVNKLKGLGFLS